MGSPAGPKWCVWFGRSLYTLCETRDEAIRCASEMRLLIPARAEEIVIREARPAELEAIASKIPEA